MPTIRTEQTHEYYRAHPEEDVCNQYQGPSLMETVQADIEARFTEKEKNMQPRTHTPTPTIESEAAALMAKFRGQTTPGLYADNPAVKMTKERAYAQALENDPEAYAAYRAAHNARPTIAALEAAGIRLAKG